MMEGDLLQLSAPIESFDCRLKALILFRHLEETDAATFSLTRKQAIRLLNDLINTDQPENNPPG